MVKSICKRRFIDYIKSKLLGNRTNNKGCVCSPHKDYVPNTLEEKSNLSEEERLYKKLSANQYKEYPYKQRDLGEGMGLVNQVMVGCWKPRYQLDNESKTAVEFMSASETLMNVTDEDID